MVKKLLDESLVFFLLAMFFIYSISYNIGYFTTLGDSLWYFFYVPITLIDIIKVGLVMLIPLILILWVFKPLIVNPAFGGDFPRPNLLLTIAGLVLVSNFLYFVFFIDSQNKSLSLISEIAFYIFSIICLITVVYYFLNNASEHSLLTIFFISLIPITFIIGMIDAKISINFNKTETKSQILMKSNNVVNANILRSFEKGVFVMINNTNSFHFIGWDEVKEIKFKKVNSL